MIMLERTLSILKPDAVRKNLIGEICNRFEKSGLTIVAIKKVQLNEYQAEKFYSVHKERVFFPDLVKFMVSGPIVVMVLEGKNAIELNRKLMGATDPKKAEPGTIRADFASSIDENVVHGSDSPDTAQSEVAYFFSERDIHS